MLKMFDNLIGAIFVSVVLIGSPLKANASLVSVDLLTTGDGLLTQDGNTGLQWMDWSVTDGLTIAQAVAAHSGFRSATASEFNTLLTNAGLPNILAYDNLSLVPAQQFVNLFNTAGTTCINSSTSGFACGYYDNGAGSARLANVGWVTGAGGLAFDGFNLAEINVASNGYGILLLRDAPNTVPEPGALMLFGVALAGLVATRLGCKQS